MASGRGLIFECSNNFGEGGGEVWVEASAGEVVCGGEEGAVWNPLS